MSIAINTNKLIHLIAGIGLLATGACSSTEKKEAQTGIDTAIVVTVATPSANGQQGINVSGQIEAVQTANISTRIMGYITKINVQAGGHVSKGQLLATINNQDMLAKRAQADAMIAQADAAFKSAQKDKERFNNLYQQQSASAKEVDNINLQYASAKAQLEAARQMRNEVNASLSYTNLTAPFDGVVTQKLADVGSMANPGMPILTIEQSGSYQVSASVPESAISQIKQGMAATITIGSVNKVLGGTVSQINQSSQFTGGQYLVKIHIPDSEKQGLLAGMYANVNIPVKNTVADKSGSDQVLVPVSSIEYKDQLTGLYTIGSNNTALLRWVRLGKTQGSKVEVLSGLSANEQFIVSADSRLYNGASVKIK
jgi:RND family efflux transporter MFP subunit